MPAAPLACASWIQSTIWPSLLDWRNTMSSEKRAAVSLAQLLHVGERGAAVFLRLARAEQVHIGAVEDVEGLGHAREPAAFKGKLGAL